MKYKWKTNNFLDSKNPSTSGQNIVDETMAEIKSRIQNNGVKWDDKEFCHRYAHSVTNYGKTVNEPRLVKSGDTGFGIWRIGKAQADAIISVCQKSLRPCSKNGFL